MEYDKKDIEKLLESYYNGNTTLEQERLLRDCFAACKTPTHGGAADAAVLGGLAAIVRRRRNRLRRRIVLAAVPAAAAVGVAVMLAAWQRTEPAPEAYCTVNGEPITDLQSAEKYTNEILGRIDDAIPEKQMLILDKLIIN